MKKISFENGKEYMEYIREKKRRKQRVLKALKETKMKYKNKKAKKAWKALKKKNADDAYGKALLKLASKWARAMQIMMAEGNDIEDIFDEALDACDQYDSITGCIESSLVSILAEYWKHGENLRACYNRHYGYTGEGVANPAKVIMQE